MLGRHRHSRYANPAHYRNGFVYRLTPRQLHALGLRVRRTWIGSGVFGLSPGEVPGPRAKSNGRQ
jgi:hypothetical protein